MLQFTVYTSVSTTVLCTGVSCVYSSTAGPLGVWGHGMGGQPGRGNTVLVPGLLWGPQMRPAPSIRLPSMTVQTNSNTQSQFVCVCMCVYVCAYYCRCGCLCPGLSLVLFLSPLTCDSSYVVSRSQTAFRGKRSGYTSLTHLCHLKTDNTNSVDQYLAYSDEPCIVFAYR